MSYEGYKQKICSNGHYFEREDIGSWEDEDPCDECGEHAVWVNRVDDTNFEDYGRIDMTPFLKPGTPETETYRVPTLKETKALRSCLYKGAIVRLSDLPPFP